MFTRIPGDLERFKSYINDTDDLQVSDDPDGYTLYPIKADGKKDYRSKDRKEIKGRPVFERWDWTADESRMWSEHRKKFNEIYGQYSQKKTDDGLKKACETQIHELVDYDLKNGLLDRIAESWNATEVQRKTFNVRQDILEIETPLRDIHIQYEKALPLNEFEKMLLEKYKAQHEYAVRIWGRAVDQRKAISKLEAKLDLLWELYPVMRDLSDKATSRIFIPGPSFKGSPSEMVQFQVPTEEEMEKSRNDFMDSTDNFNAKLRELFEELEIVEKEQDWFEGFYDETKSEHKDPLFVEVDRLFKIIFEEYLCPSIEICSLDQDRQDFWEAWGKVSDEMEGTHEDWCNFVDHYNLLNEVYNNFANYMNGVDEDGEKIEDDVATYSHTEQKFTNRPNEELDELTAETIGRYQADLDNNSNTWFDTQDWHVILDHYERRYDMANFHKALKRAFEQHPDSATMQLRKANQLADEHQYQPALDLIKKAEAQGPPHHPKLFFIKARVYRNLQSPDLAIPCYNRILVQEDQPGIKEWKVYAYNNLIEIYEEKKNYDESLRLSLAVLELTPDDESATEQAAKAYHAVGKSTEAIHLLNKYIAKHPKSAPCHLRLGHILFDKKEYTRAAESFDKAFLLDRNEFYGALYHKGKALMQMNYQFDEAAACFEQCLLYYKIDADCHVAAAQAYEKAGIPKTAAFHYRKALSYNPDCKEAIDFLTELSRKNREEKNPG